MNTPDYITKLREIVIRNWRLGDEVGLFEEVKKLYSEKIAEVEGLKEKCDDCPNGPAHECLISEKNIMIDEILALLKN